MMALLTSIYPLITSSFISTFRRNTISTVGISYGRFDPAISSSYRLPLRTKNIREFSSHSSISNSRIFLMLEEPNGNRYQEEIICGSQALNQLINSVRYEVSPLRSSNMFTDWFQSVGTRKLITDSEYRSKLFVREIKRKHSQVLDPIVTRLRNSQTVLETTTEYIEWKELERLITSGNHAVDSMEKFLIENYINDVNTAPRMIEKLESVRSLLPTKQKDLAINLARYNELRASSAALQEYEEAMAQYTAIACEVGLTCAEQFKSDARKEGGSGRNFRGKSFESQSVEIVRSCLLPYLADKYNVSVEDMLIVQNLRLGMASSNGSTAEIDSVVCVRNGACPKPKGTYVTVLAIVEVKRNPDDIGSAFVNYQAPLAWLTGISDPSDSARWVTKSYPKGIFDRPFIQVHQGEPLVFTQESFKKLTPRKITSIMPVDMQNFFEASTGSKLHFVDDLFFVVKDGPVDCMISRSVATVLSMIADCEELDATNSINSDQQIQALESIRINVDSRYPTQLTTFDLLKLYEKLSTMNQLFVVK